MRDPFVKLRLKDARTIADPIRRPAASYELELALRRLDDLIDAAEKLAARKKARPLKQQHEKPSKLDRLRKAHGKRGAKARKTMEVYGAVEQRAGGVCECGCGTPFDQTMDGAPEMDHFWGRGATGAKAESVETCWMLRREHHRAKTDGNPSRIVWLGRFRSHARICGYTAQASLARQEFEADLEIALAADLSRAVEEVRRG